MPYIGEAYAQQVPKKNVKKITIDSLALFSEHVFNLQKRKTIGNF